MWYKQHPTNYVNTLCTHTHIHTLSHCAHAVCLVVYWLSAVVLGVRLVDGLMFNKYTFSYTTVLLLLLFFVISFIKFDSREKENVFYWSLHSISFVIYWLCAMTLGVCLVWLLLTVKYTFIHIIVVLLLFFLVFSFIYIIIKIAIDWFYNREIKNPFRYITSYVYEYCT